MLEIITKSFEDKTADVEAAVRKADMRALSAAAYDIFRDAQESIEQSGRRSPAGHPPHTRHGQLRRSLRYSVERDREMAAIGPRESMVGTSAMASEFGGNYRGGRYPTRPFMAPALEKNVKSIPSRWSAEVHN